MKNIWVILCACIFSGCLSSTQNYVTSSPSGADVYWACQDASPTDSQWRKFRRAKTPLDFTHSSASCWYKVKKDGYHESNVVKLTHESTSHHFDLKSTKQEITTPISSPPKLPYIISKIDIKSSKSDSQKEPILHDERRNYFALVIGNNQYSDLPALQTALNDAHTVAMTLQNEYGYNVSLLTNATRAQILQSLEKFRTTLTTNDNLLIYYAGHGWLDKDGNEGYWLPVDATNSSSINWISNGSITTILRAIQAKHVMVVADSCYSGKLARGISIKQKSPDYIQKIASLRARTVLASGGLEPVADGGGRGNHSVFASAFIKALKQNQGVLDASELFNQIRRPIVLNSDQVPEYADIRKAGHDGGDFLFIRK